MTPVKKGSKKVEAAVAEEIKAVAEAIAEPKEEVIEEVKAAVKKASSAKKTVKKAAEAAVTEAKKATKKAAASAKKAAAPEASVFVEFYGKQVAAKAVLEQALSAYRESHKDEEVKNIEIYIKPEENAAYYVVNGTGADDFRIEL